MKKASPSLEPKLLVVTLRAGRLANRLVLFATVIAFAEEYGHRVVNFAFHSNADLFETTSRDIYCRYPPARRRSWLDAVPGTATVLRKLRLFYHLTRAAAQLNDRFPVFGGKMVTLRGSEGQRLILLNDSAIQEKLRPARIIFVHHWGFRATDLVQKHAEKIRKYFQPMEKLARSSHETVERLRRNANTVIGVHIRHGDYRRWKSGKYFFPVSRYAEWMREFAAHFPNQKVAFLICSDEPRDAAEFPGLSVGFGTDSPVSDLYALSKCDYLIGPPSTFSQWASFQGKTPMFHLRDSNTQIKLENFQISNLEWQRED